jgi:RNA polymerase sigma factor (sigma-70 family)
MFLRGLVGPDAADDCLQETLMAALCAYQGLEHATNLRGWLFTIAHRKGIDHLRSRGREYASDEIPEASVVDEEPPEPLLWEHVAGLPDKQRAAVTLRFVGDMAYAAIAQVIDCSEAAARQNVRAGLATLRKGITT